MRTYFVRTLKVIIGLLLFALGNYISIQANIGLAPWDAFHQGIANITHLSFGTVVVLSGVVILIIDLLMKEKIGLATILNTLLIGVFVDMFAAMNLVPKIPGNGSILLLLLGQVILCFGTYYYVCPGLGAGPRDSLMVAVGKRMPKVPIGAVRGVIEGTALLIGWLLGAKVGIGTVVSVFGIGFILQAVLFVVRFDIKSVRHEHLLQTIQQIKKILFPPKQQPTE